MCTGAILYLMYVSIFLHYWSKVIKSNSYRAAIPATRLSTTTATATITNEDVVGSIIVVGRTDGNGDTADVTRKKARNNLTTV